MEKKRMAHKHLKIGSGTAKIRALYTKGVTARIAVHNDFFETVKARLENT